METRAVTFPCVPPLQLAAFVFKYHNSPQRFYSRDTTAAFQAFPFVASTNGAAALVCERVCILQQ